MALNFSKMNFSVSFNPTSAFPLDARSYFESYDLALAAVAKAVEAGSAEGTLYFGQTVAVVENGIAQLYIIQPDKTLSEVGGKITVNENVFDLDENGKLNLVGFAEAAAGAQLLKGSDGKLSWVKPDNTTVEGLLTIVAGLQEDIKDIQDALNPVDEEGNPVEGGLVSDVKDLEDAVGEAAEYDEEGNLITPATGIFKDIEDIETQIGDPANSELNQAATGLYAELDKKANAEDVYTKDDADKAIAAAIANVEHLKREVVSELPEVEDADANTIYMVPSGLLEDDNKYYEWILINNVFEQVGSWEVNLDAYALKSELSDLADIVNENKTAAEQAIAAEKSRAEAAEKANADAIALKANAADVYTKSETDSAIADAVKSATGGESASDVLIALNNYKKAVNTEVWGSEVADENLTSTPSRIDALEEAVTNLQNEEPYISSVNEEEFQVSNGKLSLGDVFKSTVSNLSEAVTLNTTRISSLEDSLNGYVDEDDNEVEGLFSKVNKLSLQVDGFATNYVAVADFNALVNRVGTLETNQTSMIDDLTIIKEILAWQEMSAINS